RILQHIFRVRRIPNEAIRQLQRPIAPVQQRLIPRRQRRHLAQFLVRNFFINQPHEHLTAAFWKTIRSHSKSVTKWREIESCPSRTTHRESKTTPQKFFASLHLCVFALKPKTPDARQSKVP